MRKPILAAVAILAIGSIGTGTMIAEAQPASPPAPETGGAPGPGMDAAGGPHRPGMDEADGPHRHWDRHLRAWWHHMREDRQRMVAPGTFALVYRHADRQLSPADVQTIAQAFLLWNGNHSWKVIDVAAAPDGLIGFAYTTQQGGVIAHLTMDPHTGRIARVD